MGSRPEDRSCSCQRLVVYNAIWEILGIGWLFQVVAIFWLVSRCAFLEPMTIMEFFKATCTWTESAGHTMFGAKGLGFVAVIQSDRVYVILIRIDGTSVGGRDFPGF